MLNYDLVETSSTHLVRGLSLYIRYQEVQYRYKYSCRTIYSLNPTTEIVYDVSHDNLRYLFVFIVMAISKKSVCHVDMEKLKKES